MRLSAGFERVVEKEAGTFKYFLKIVPTEYVNLRGKISEASYAYLESPGKVACAAVCAFVRFLRCITSSLSDQHCYSTMTMLWVMPDA